MLAVPSPATRSTSGRSFDGRGVCIRRDVRRVAHTFPRKLLVGNERDSAPCACITTVVIIRPVIRSFADAATEDIFHGHGTRRARQACPQVLWSVARRKLDQINRVRAVEDLRIPPGNRLEQLRGNRSGQYSIRVNDQYRVCFRWEDGYADEVEITDYH